MNKIPKMLTRQSANLSRPETMAEKQQSGNGCASTGEVYMSAENVKGAISAENPEIPRKEDQKKQNRDQEIHTVDNIQGSTEVNNGARRKRGRPKKHIGEGSTGANMDIQDSCVGDEARSSAENDFLMTTTVDDIPIIGDFHLFPNTRKKPRNGVPYQKGVLSKTANTPLLEGLADETVNQTKNSVSNGHEELRKTVDTESEVQGALPVGEQDGNRNSILQETCGPTRYLDLNLCPDSNDKGGESGPPAIVSVDTTEDEESPLLPFVKRSQAWESICSTATYRKMPQKPHFRPLKEYAVEFREGMAMGLVVSFDYVVENTSKLQFSSDITAIEGGLKKLAKFKSHGFDVDKVEAGLTQLLLAKQRAEELRKKYEHIESKILSSVDEGKRDEEEISQLSQHVREMEKKLGEAELKKENREKALSALQSERVAVAEKLQSIRVEFENTVGSLF